ncbi:Protein of unknown function [Gryllus bimaculatus]|nr:Protein of unknown function [Gryllus bimaculatus]
MKRQRENNVLKKSIITMKIIILLLLLIVIIEIQKFGMKGTPEDASESVRTRSLYTAYSYHEETVESCQMWYKGVSFTSEQCALVYLVDAAGTRTTTDNFCDMGQDFSLPVFYNDSRHGPSYFQEAVSILQSSQYWVTEEGIENWIVNNVRVSQTQDGLVRVARNSNKYQLRTSPSNGTASLTTPFLHCTASMGQTSHLFVRRGERRMHYDGASFIVRNAGHSAGFDEKNQLKVY